MYSRGECACRACANASRSGPLCVRHADGLHLVRLQHCVVVEVARVIDQHAVAGLEQETAEQIDRVRTGFGQQDLLHGYIDAERGAAPLQQLAQRGSPSGPA